MHGQQNIKMCSIQFDIFFLILWVACGCLLAGKAWNDSGSPSGDGSYGQALESTYPPLLATPDDGSNC